jgi:histidinol-phosphate aminotransferase
MSLIDQIAAHIRQISPYVPGKPITQLAREMGLSIESIVKLASNENPLGMSPLARAAVQRALDGLERYPDQFELIDKLAKTLHVAPAQIVLGNGSNDVLDLIARVFVGPGKQSIYAQHAFAIYPIATLSAGGECLEVPAREFGHDLDAMRAAIGPACAIVWLANPNNPTGTFISQDRVRAFIASVPAHIAVVLDEAYNDYLAPADRADTVSWVADFPNLIVTRSFSKVYGLAGLRIGYGVASAPVADLLNRLRQPFNVNNLALAAAQAALDDSEFLARTYQVNCAGRAQLESGFTALGLSFIPSQGNFVSFAVPAALTGAQVNARLQTQGVIVRPIAGYGLPNHLRVTVGLAAENERFLVALKKAISSDTAAP